MSATTQYFVTLPCPQCGGTGGVHTLKDPATRHLSKGACKNCGGSGRVRVEPKREEERK